MTTSASFVEVTQAELDAKVTDAIVDGVTTVAPSQNATFDALALKAPLASPALTGNPTVPTAAPGDNDTTAASTAFVAAAVGAAGSLTDQGVWAAATNYARGDVVTYGGHRFVRLGAAFVSGAQFDPANWAPLDRVSPDNPASYGASLGLDIESLLAHGASSAALPAGVTYDNQGTATVLQQYGAVTLQAPSTAGIAWRTLKRSLAGAAAAWLGTMKVGATAELSSSDSVAGLVLRESSSGKLLTFYNYSSASGESNIYIVRWASATDTGPTVVAGPLKTWPVGFMPYLRVRKNSAVSYDFEYSRDGQTWYSMLAGHNPSAFVGSGLDEIGGGGYVAGKPWQLAINFLRVR